MKKVKRGVSPVIATVLLVLLAVILAVIIFLWARSILTEKAQKDMGKGPIQVEEVCKSVKFNAEVSSFADSKVSVELSNAGNVPIFGIELLKVSAGREKIVGTATFPLSDIDAIKAGKTHIFSDVRASLSKNDEVIVVPIILGKVKNSYKQHLCDKEYGIATKVI
jgi:flagellin-like protein